jgi:glutathione S-transferase
MKLYGALASPYVGRVALFARIKGIDLAMEFPPGGGIKSAEYLAINPLGKMPTLDVDGQYLPESEVICEYLEDVAGGRSGIPGAPLDRARARLVARLYDLYVAPHGSLLFRNSNPATRDQAVVDAALSGIKAGFGHLEHFMTVNPFAAGEALSIADAALLPGFVLLKRVVVPTYGLDDPTAGRGRLAEWWRAISADELCAAFLKDYDAAVDAFLKMLASSR